MTRALIGGLVFIHRWVGITIGLLMLMWCLSGVVMMYVSYPSLSESARQAALPVLVNQPIVVPARMRDDTPVRQFTVEMANGQPTVGLAGGGRRGGGGSNGPKPTPDQMLAVASGFGPKASLMSVVKVDQWTLDGQSRQGPLYRYDLHDPARTWVYVSSQTGKAVQIVDARQRFWNWFGAVPHWLYPTLLRRNGRVWTQVVIYASLVGTFLAAIGLILGIVRIRKGRLSPYKGWHMWHHLVGLAFGVLLLTWVASGLLSMNPWGLLEGGGGAGDEAPDLAGGTPTWADAKPAIQAALASPAAQGAVALRSAPFDGRMFVLATRKDGSQVRLDANGQAAPFTAADRQRVIALFGDNAKAEVLTHEDAYYFSSMGERGYSKVALPVIRAIMPDGFRYYVDAETGQMGRRIDGDRKGTRWLQEGFHTLNFTPLMRMRPVWDILMIALLTGCSALCATGLWIGARRLGLVPMGGKRRRPSPLQAAE